MERIIDRFDKYMMYKGLNDNRVTKEIGLSVGLIGKCRKEGRDMTRGLALQILQCYTDLSSDWLLDGKGDMLKESKVVIENRKSVSEIERENEHLRQVIELKEEIRRQDLQIMEMLKIKSNGDQELIKSLNERIKELEEKIIKQ